MLLACAGCIEPDNLDNAVDPNARVGGDRRGPNFRKMKNKLLPQFVGNPAAALEEFGVEIRRDKGGRITRINCRDTEITDGHLERMNAMTALERLNLESCAYITDDGLKFLKPLTALRHLSLIATSISDAGLAHLQGMELATLRIPEEAKTDLGLRNYLMALAARRRLHLKGWPISDAGLAHLQVMAGLEALSISGVPITDAGLRSLSDFPKLRAIGFRDLSISDAGLVHFRDMDSLTRLVLIRTNVTAAGVHELQKALPNCEIVAAF